MFISKALGFEVHDLTNATFGILDFLLINTSTKLSCTGLFRYVEVRRLSRKAPQYLVLVRGELARGSIFHRGSPPSLEK